MTQNDVPGFFLSFFPTHKNLLELNQFSVEKKNLKDEQ